MKVEDVFVHKRRLWVRLREKGSKAHTMPCHHNLEEYLAAYLDGTGLRDDPKRALFPSLARGKPGRPLTRTPMHQADAHDMIRRCSKAAGIATPIGNHSFRATGITAYQLRHAGEGRRDGEPRLDAHDAALRSPAR
jgi:integrase/recombinase XerC